MAYDLVQNPVVLGKLVQHVGPCYGLRIIPSPLHVFLMYPVTSGPFRIIRRVLQGLYGDAGIPNRNLLRAFYAAVKKAGLKDLRWHDATRHTFATRLVQGGVDIYAVQKLGRLRENVDIDSHCLYYLAKTYLPSKRFPFPPEYLGAGGYSHCSICKGNRVHCDVLKR
jgi:hypothetical protein